MTTILVLIEELEAVRALNGDLEQARYGVVGADDGQAALGLLEREQPDLLMLDLALPGLDRPEVCRRLRQVSDAQVLVLTADVEEATSTSMAHVCEHRYRRHGTRRIQFRPGILSAQFGLLLE